MADQPPYGPHIRGMSSITADELWRRMDQQDKWWDARCTAIEARAAEDRRSFVPSSVYEERHLALRDRVHAVEEELENQERLRTNQEHINRIFRQQMLIAVIASMISAVGAIIATIVAIVLH